MIILIQARTGSTRLPNKMVTPFYKEQFILDILLERLKNTLANEVPIVVATSDKEQDRNIVDIAKRNKVSFFQGSESDVLNRFIGALEQNNANSCIRICADNPFLSMRYLLHLIDFVEKNHCDYASFMTSDNIPSIKTHFGLWTEYITLDALKRIKNSTDEKLYHEHVTNYAYSNMDSFNCKFIQIDSYVEKNPFRLTVDTREDFEVAQKIYRKLMENKLEVEPENIIPLLNNEMKKTMVEQIHKNGK